MSQTADTLESFRHFREKMNAAIRAAGNINFNRFFALDSRVYEGGALPAKTKERRGFVASRVLGCDDWLTYHRIRCRVEGVTDAEFDDAFAVGVVVGGSIVTLHLKRVVARLAELPAK